MWTGECDIFAVKSFQNYKSVSLTFHIEKNRLLYAFFGFSETSQNLLILSVNKKTLKIGVSRKKVKLTESNDQKRSFFYFPLSVFFGAIVILFEIASLGASLRSD